MNVKELRKALTELIKQGQGEVTVLLEGCDCNGELFKVGEVRNGTVLLERD